MQHNSWCVFYSTVMISVKFSSGPADGCPIIFRHLTIKQQENNKKEITTIAVVAYGSAFFANFSAALLNGGVLLFRSARR